MFEYLYNRFGDHAVYGICDLVSNAIIPLQNLLKDLDTIPLNKNSTHQLKDYPEIANHFKELLIKKCNDSEFKEINDILNRKLYEIKFDSIQILRVATIKLLQFILYLSKSDDIVKNVLKLLNELYSDLDQDLDYKTIHKNMLKLPFEGNIHQFIFYIDTLYKVNDEENEKWLNKKMLGLREYYCEDNDNEDE